MLSTNDLQRVSAEKAAAVLVLCDKFSQEPVKEDLSNIMRVISLKNYSETTRCIIQLLYYSSKVRILKSINMLLRFVSVLCTISIKQKLKGTGKPKRSLFDMNRKFIFSKQEKYNHQILAKALRHGYP